MEPLARMAAHGHEQVAHWNDPAVGLRAIIAIHSTALGPSLGGCRMHPYASEEEALADVLRLSRAMTYKAAVAGVRLGGGKSVIMGDPATQKTDALLRSFGRFVGTLGGRYTASEDMGTCMADLDIMRTVCPHISDDYRQAEGGINSLTALGTFEGIRAALAFATGSPDLAGRVVAVQGLGHVGWPLCQMLAEAGATLIVADLSPERVHRAVAHLGARSVAPEEVLAQECDVLSPCAMGSVLDRATIGSLRCAVVAGSANNVLATDADGDRLHERGIVLAPDYVVNAGGLINAADERSGYRAERAAAAVATIRQATATVLARAAAESVTTAEAAERVAADRIAAMGAIAMARPAAGPVAAPGAH